MGRVAVVTGGSRGIGAATAVLLAKLGWGICIGYKTDKDAATRVVGECEALGRSVLAVQADVATENDVLSLFARVDSELGALSALVNNAGIVGPKSRVDEMSPERLANMMAVNGAMDTFTLGLAREVATEGIRVNAVRPGLIDTDIHANNGQPNRLDELEPSNRSLHRRLGRPLTWR